MTVPKSAVSLRRSLLRRLVAPLAVLALTSGLAAFLLAWHATQRSVDHTLFQYANAVAQQIRIAGPNDREIARQLSNTMLSDPSDALYYRIICNADEIGGRSDLPLSGTSPRTIYSGMIFESTIDGSDARIAQVQLLRPDGSHILVEVGQLDSHRYAIAAEFLFSIMAPLLLLLVAGWIIVVRAISQQINPLIGLADTLNQQTHNSLEPVDESHVPAEIRPLTSALNALLERLKTALEGQRTFIADAAHQLRTPLTAVKLHAEQAATSSDPKIIQSAVHEVRAAADRAIRLSNQLLSLARAEPGEHAANFVSVDLAALTFETGAEWVPRALSKDVDMGFQRHDVLTLISGRPLIEQDSALDVNPHLVMTMGAGNAYQVVAENYDSNVALASELDYEQGSGSPLHVAGNPVLLREAITNLIDNALKYAIPRAGTGGRITLSIGRTPLAAEPDSRPGTQRHIDLIIEDNGPGVPAELQRDLFKRFFRGDASTGLASGSTTGAGLGLAIVRNIAVLHRGEIFYETSESGGSRFVIRLPMLDPTQVEQLVVTDSKKKTVLRAHHRH
jgi:signal transduction histidine kinase